MAFQRRRRFVRRTKSGLYVWNGFVGTLSLLTGAQNNVTLADAASFATTSGNAKKMGTLLRIRGSFSCQAASAGTTFFGGICLTDVAESVQPVNAATYDQDEDVLWRKALIFATGAYTGHHTIDIKAKRIFNPESVLQMNLLVSGSTVTMPLQVRMLWHVP